MSSHLKSSIKGEDMVNLVMFDAQGESKILVGETQFGKVPWPLPTLGVSFHSLPWRTGA